MAHADMPCPAALPNGGPAPHPPFGHLLPASGEKEAFERRPRPLIRSAGIFSPRAGRRRRSNGGPGPSSALRAPSPRGRAEGGVRTAASAPHLPCGHLLPAGGEKEAFERRPRPLIRPSGMFSPRAGRRRRSNGGPGPSSALRAPSPRPRGEGGVPHGGCRVGVSAVATRQIDSIADRRRPSPRPRGEGARRAGEGRDGSGRERLDRGDAAEAVRRVSRPAAP